LTTKFKSLLKLDLVKISVLNAGLIFLRVVLSFILSKFLALMVGPSGLALIGQLTNAIQAMVTTGTLASNQAVTKYSAEYKNEPDKYFGFVISTLKAVLIASFLIGSFSFIFAEWLSYKVFDTNEYSNIFRIFALNISLFALNGLLLALINGKKLFREYVIVNVIVSIVSTGLTIGLIWFFGIFGGLVSYATAQSVVLLFTLYIVRKEVFVLISKFNKYKLDPKWIKLLLAFSLMTFVSMFLAPISKLFVRNEIIENISLNAAGIWEGMNKITSLFLMLFTSTIPIYYLPRLSELKTTKLLRKEVFLSFKIVVPVVFFAALVVYFLRYYVVMIALSTEFLQMTELFGVQLFGDVLRVISLVFSFALVAKAKVKQFVYVEIIAVTIYMISAHFMVQRFGLIGSIWAYTLCYGVYALLSYLLFQKHFKVSE